jgi:DNA-binding MarR family transcriptional regulator
MKPHQGSLRESIQQTRPFESKETEAILTLIWAQDRVLERALEPLGPTELSLAQYNVLRILRGSPEGLETRQVCDRLIARAPNLTRLVDKLEAKGYLRRRRDQTDRRVIHLVITPEGLRHLESLDQPMAESTRRAMSALSARDLDTLIRLLNRMAGPSEPADPDRARNQSGTKETPS